MCKRALEESNWDEEEAVVYLRKAGVARASLAANRDAAAGVVAVYRSTDGTQCTAVVLSCETDFVQKNPKFVAFSQALAEHCYATLRSSDTGLSDALGSLLVNQLKSSRASPTLSSCVQSGSTASADSVSELLADLTTQFGETVEVKAVVSLDSNASSCIGVYVHNETTPGAGVGSAAAVVELSWVPSNGPATASATLRGRLSKFARLIAMQVLATSPKFVDLHSIPSSVVEKERAIAEAAAATRTKGAPAPPPSSAAETKGTPFSKIAEQRLQRSLEEQCLLSQEFFMVKQLHEDVLRDTQAEAATDGRGGSCTSTARNQQQRQLTVADALQFVGQTLGCSLTVSRMRLISLGSQ
ncbi:elongation factor ts, putative [Eimeria maxima]|uniref:Elongation factor Ts, mitochondrial n=1 Tax=Eimeria maxima TaxID=5804 RepID=U6M521_EIMMA|nr:elongation factor ts, putative [Eimeria maxima]CDJ59111.1 elongation factor ts, putative [Eimeria maxima]